MNDMTVPPAPAAPTTIVVATPSPALLGSVEDMLALAQSYTGAVCCPEMRVALSEDLQRNKAMQATIESERVKITKPLFDATRNTNTLFKKLSTPLEMAESIMKKEAIRWDSEQERQRRNAEAESARKADDERKRLQAQAAQQAAAGNTETAHAITAAAQMVAPVPVASPAPKIAGEAHRETWSGECFDIVALCRAIADGNASSELVLPNMPVLNAQARSLKATLSIPGVRAVMEKTLASRAA